METCSHMKLNYVPISVSWGRFEASRVEGRVTAWGFGFGFLGMRVWGNGLGFRVWGLVSIGNQY